MILLVHAVTAAASHARPQNINQATVLTVPADPATCQLLMRSAYTTLRQLPV